MFHRHLEIRQYYKNKYFTKKIEGSSRAHELTWQTKFQNFHRHPGITQFYRIFFINPWNLYNIEKYFTCPSAYKIYGIVLNDYIRLYPCAPKYFSKIIP